MSTWFHAFCTHAISEGAGDRPALLEFTHSLVRATSYSELRARAMAVGGGLLAAGLRRGEAVAHLCDEGEPMVLAFMATAAVG